MASYAAIAKGRSASAPSTKPSSAGASGTTTPASTSIPELTPGTNWADDAESKDSAQSASQASTDISSAPSAQAKSNEKPRTDAKPSKESKQSNQAGGNETKDTPASAETSSEEKASASQNGEKPASEEQGAEGEKKDEAEEKAPPKPVYTEAKPPAVNIWAQRAAEQKAKIVQPSATIPQSATQSNHLSNNDSDRGKFDNRRRSEQAFGRDYKRGDVPGRPRDDFRGSKGRREVRADEGTNRRAPVKPRDRASSEVLPPSVSSEVAWPKPTDSAIEEEKKKPNDEKDRAATGGKPHGKTEWKSIPFTPTAVFETRLEGKPSIRMGKGSGRPAPVGAVRGPQQGSPSAEGQRSGARVPSLPNGDHKGSAAANAAKAEREVMPAPPAKTSTEGEAGNTTGNTSSSDASAPPQNGISPSKESSESNAAATSADQSDLNGRAIPFTHRTSPRQNDTQTRRPPHDTPNRQSSGTQTNGESNPKKLPVPSSHPQDLALTSLGNAGTSVEQNAQTPRSAYSERRSEPHLYENGREHGSFREGKRGGRKGGRGAFNNSFTSPNPYAAGYGDFPGGQLPLSPTGNFFPGRGGSHGGRGYRNQGHRSQSIPLDAYGRPAAGYPGYPMMQPMQPYMGDYYGPYSAGPYPVHPSAEREMQTMAARGQMEYYFSIDNLLKDIFLRKQMDSQGWIFLQVIAQFNRMKQMTTDYETLKSACLQSVEVEIRIGEDGKERVRKARDWEQWVLPKEDRDPAAQTDGPSNLRRPSPVRNQFFEQQQGFPQSPGAMGGRRGDFHMQDAAAAPTFFPGSMDPGFADFQPAAEESRGRQVKPHRDSTASPLTNGLGAAPEDGEPDRFPMQQIEELTVVVRKHDVRPAPHNANTRTFSNGSIDTRNIMEEVMRGEAQPATPLTNGTSNHSEQYVNLYPQLQSMLIIRSQTPLSPSSAQPNGPVEQEGNSLSLFWVKDQNDPVDSTGLPVGTTHELYSILRSKALAQREAAATGTCPYDLDVLYQFWSHFLIRNFNSQMYYEFKTLAAEDASQRHNDVGMSNLIKYYSEALASQIGIRENIARDYAELIKLETSKSSRPAFGQLHASWRSGSLNLKNRKKLGDFLDETLKAELDS